MSWLQERLQNANSRVYLNSHFKDAIDNFCLLAANVCNRPTRIAEIIPETPLHVRCSNAAGPDMGGVWLAFYLSSLGANLASVKDTSRSAETAESLCALGARTTPPATRRPPPQLPPTLWRFKFPPEITSQLVSWSNPEDSINNSDLELASVLGHNIVLLQLTDLREITTATGTDNVVAHSWSSKQARSSTGPASYLLRLQAVHQQQFRYQAKRHD